MNDQITAQVPVGCNRLGNGKKGLLNGKKNGLNRQA
jgi:hypothetical protein